ncbi:MAG: M1 family metallopeptidase [Puia sp.]|nr:M1 family metallopeptidase [Puia sp.]
MKKLFLLLLIFATHRIPAHAQPAAHRETNPKPVIPAQRSAAAPSYWQQEVDYRIDVSLNDIEHTLDGLAKIKYTNHSPDTLFFIWFHCWPNAFKNDQTAYSEQLLGNGRTDFYFSDKQERGYINRLDFRVDGTTAHMEDHPQYIDIIKLLLPTPLAPGSQAEIAVSFHEQLPFDFSGYGHTGQSYQLTQWYPQPAVYDCQGWHPMPWLDQGDVYGEYGDYDVHITLPANYAVAATGELLEGDAAPPFTPTPRSASSAPPPVPSRVPSARTSPVKRTDPSGPTSVTRKPQPAKPPLLTTAFSKKNKDVVLHIPSDTASKTLRFRQQHVQDFAWFADKSLRRNQDTLQLNSGRVLTITTFYRPKNPDGWENSIRFIKDAIRFRSTLIGEYPFNNLTAVAWNDKSHRDRAYPSLIVLSGENGVNNRHLPRDRRPGSPSLQKNLDLRIAHEIGLNWFGAALGSDRRRYPWMDEGMATYYDRRYEAAKYPGYQPASSQMTQPRMPHSRISHPSQATPRLQPPASPPPAHAEPSPGQWNDLFTATLIEVRLDQPISSSSTDFTAINYRLMAATKTAAWMKHLEDSLGASLFDSCMHAYYGQWQFRHPYPQDFHSLLESASGHNLDQPFRLLDERGPLAPAVSPKKIKPAFLFSTQNTGKIEYINMGPAIGYNEYDKFMIGALIHNFNLPPTPFQFLLAPLYATNSRQLTGLGRMSYSIYPGGGFHDIEFALDGARFSTLSATDSNGNKIFGGFYKIVPSVRLTLKKKDDRSTVETWVGFKTFLIGEKQFNNYVMKSTDSMYYPLAGAYAFRYLNQLSLNFSDDRVLYPYNAQLQFQQASRFYRVNFTGNYFFNYASGGGMAVRVFAAKFGYLGGRSPALDLSGYEPKLTGVRGNEDYTYSNYFLGRSEFTGFASQQLMIRDGGLKIQVPQFPYLEGRSDNWVAATNFNSTLPPRLFPFPVPIKVFLDIGTYAGGWQNNPPTSKFLYVAGLQLSLLHNSINFYAPIFYSSDFGDQLKTIPQSNTFWKKISFSIDLQNIDYRKMAARAMAAKVLN